MARPILDEKLWVIVEPLLPAPKRRRKRYPGRKPLDPRQCLTGILYVLKTGIPWEVSASGNGLWFGNELLARPAGLAESRSVEEAPRDPACQTRSGRADRLVSIPRRQQLGANGFWGAKTGPNPTDRRKWGSKHHLLTEAQGIPLSFRLTGANRHDVTQLFALLDGVPRVRGKQGGLDIVPTPATARSRLRFEVSSQGA